MPKMEIQNKQNKTKQSKPKSNLIKKINAKQAGVGKIQFIYQI